MIDIDEGFFKTNSLSTAGAISVRDAKGRLVTQKVKVRRYAAGKLYVRFFHYKKFQKTFLIFSGRIMRKIYMLMMTIVKMKSNNMKRNKSKLPQVNPISEKNRIEIDRFSESQ